MANSQMNKSTLPTLLQPIFQYGFAGMAAVLIAVIVWMMHCRNEQFDHLLQMQQQTNQVIERNTSAIEQLKQIVHDKL